MTSPRSAGRLLVALLLAAGGSLRAADTEHLRFLRPIGVPPRASEELVAVRIDSPVLAATADGYPDLRVLDARGREVSRLVRQASVVKMGAARTSFPVESPRVAPLPGGGLEIEFTIDPVKHPRPFHGFRIETPLHDFEQRVRVHRLDDTGAWRPIGDDTLLYDYSRFMDTRQLDVAFPREPREPAGGTWRITVDEATIEQQSTLAELVRTLEGGAATGQRERVVVARQPFRIDAIRAWRDEDVAEIRGADAVGHPVAAFRVEEEPKEQRTRIRVTTGREPVRGFELVVDDRNFGRSARVERPAAAAGGGAAGHPARVLGSGRIHRVDLRGISREETIVRIPESRFPEYEIVVENGDSQALSIRGVTAIGPAEEVVFLARPGEAYRLAYGGVTDEARPFPQPRYDTTAIDTALAAGQVPAEGTLGPVERREVAPVERPWLARILNDRWILGGLIALLAILLALSLVGAARRVGPPGNGSPGG